MLWTQNIDKLNISYLQSLNAHYTMDIYWLEKLLSVDKVNNNMGKMIWWCFKKSISVATEVQFPFLWHVLFMEVCKIFSIILKR